MKTFRVRTCQPDEEHFQFIDNILNKNNANLKKPWITEDLNTANDFLKAKAWVPE